MGNKHNWRNLRNGFTPLRGNSEFWSNGTIPWFTVEDANKQGNVISYTTQKINKIAASAERIVPAQSILLCCTSATIGRVVITDIDLTTNQQFNALTIKEKYKNQFDYRFLFWFCNTLKEELIAMAGITTFPFVAVGKLSKMPIPLPPLAEQQRIVKRIEELFEWVDKLAKLQTA